MHSPIRTRLALAMAVPVAALVVLAAAEAALGLHDHRSAAHVSPWLALAVASVVVGTVAVLRVSHSVTAPLVRLAAFAEDLADHRMAEAVTAILAGAGPDEEHLLPSPPSAHGNDEVAAVARALAAVRDRALSLAVEQAAIRRDMAEALTNLGRRNQNLVSRQLDYITSIEKGEVDPDKLDQLFRLDHLATRMRRNAESLLVLGGAESPRQWSAPVALVDVVRSALAEVEDFRRVALGRISPVAVAGRVTSDLSHLLAELLENGLSYSPPHTDVRVEGAVVNGSYVLTITDRGIGMHPDTLVQANARLAGGQAVTGSPSRYLGLFVAGELARRHGITVTLDAAVSGGTVATVTLPPAVVPGLLPSADALPPASDAHAPVAAAPTGPAPTGPAPTGPAQTGPPPTGSAPGPATPAPPVVGLPTVPWSPATPAPPAVPAPVAQGGPSAVRQPRPRRRDDLLALLETDEPQVHPRRPRTGVTAPPDPAPPTMTPAPLPPVTVPAAPEVDPFEAWLDSRLEQLARKDAERAATAEPGADGQQGTRPVGDAGDPSELPRRRPGAAGGGDLSGLRRRTTGEAPDPAPTGDEAPPPAPDTPRVSSSLFRYLSAVDQRSDDPSQEGRSR